MEGRELLLRRAPAAGRRVAHRRHRTRRARGEVPLDPTRRARDLLGLSGEQLAGVTSFESLVECRARGRLAVFPTSSGLWPPCSPPTRPVRQRADWASIARRRATACGCWSTPSPNSELMARSCELFPPLLEFLTDRKRVEESFLQAQKMEGLGRLAGGLAPRLQQSAGRESATVPPRRSKSSSRLQELPPELRHSQEARGGAQRVSCVSCSHSRGSRQPQGARGRSSVDGARR